MMLPWSGGGAAGDVDGKGGAGDGMADAIGGGGVGDAPGGGAAGDAHGAGAAGDAPGVGAAGDVDGEGAAGDAMVDGVAGDVLTVRVLQGVLRWTAPMVRVLEVLVLGAGPCVGGHRWFWGRALASPGGGPGGRCWSVCSPNLAVLAASGVGAADGEGGAGDGVVDAYGEGALQVLHRVMSRARAL